MKSLKKMVFKDKTVPKSSTPPNGWNRFDIIFRTNSIVLMSGIGEEHLLDKDNNTIAIFIDGNFKSHCITVQSMDIETLVGAA
jgi:hypothetical protein